MHKDNIGLYIHIPFCEKKCAYCDFYSCIPSEDVINEYLSALEKQIKKWGGELSCPIDTLYIGGGTPSLLGEKIIPLIENVRDNFYLSENAEITAELNPCSAKGFLRSARIAGVNRLSIGVQSGSDKMLKVLGRNHTREDAINTVKQARELGFDNISVDLMIGLVESDINSLKADIDFILCLNPDHISSYILKIEEKTAFAKMADKLNLPDDDQIAEQYLYMCERLKSAGFEHYEISNFAKPKKQSRHNLKYWQCREYLGLGPAAHSYIGGERFYYPSNLKDFINSPQLISDGNGGDSKERLMLGLRLSEGIDLTEIYSEIHPKYYLKYLLLVKRDI